MLIETCNSFPISKQYIHGASQLAQWLKNPPANAGDTGNVDSIPQLGRSPGIRNGNPLWYSCLENSMDRETWRATVHWVTKESDMTEHSLLLQCT
jgi:hypothetical protein